MALLHGESHNELKRGSVQGRIQGLVRLGYPNGVERSLRLQREVAEDLFFLGSGGHWAPQNAPRGIGPCYHKCFHSFVCVSVGRSNSLHFIHMNRGFVQVKVTKYATGGSGRCDLYALRQMFRFADFAQEELKLRLDPFKINLSSFPLFSHCV